MGASSYMDLAYDLFIYLVIELEGVPLKVAIRYCSFP